MDEEDIQIHYSHRMVLDPVQGREYSSDICRHCPHPAVVEKYGENVQLSNYTCKNCKHKIFNDMGFIECGYRAKEPRSLTDEEMKRALDM